EKRFEVDRFVLQVGGGSPGDANKGSVLVTLKDRGMRGVAPELGHEPSQQEFMDICRKEFKKIDGVKTSIQDLSNRAFSASRGYGVEFVVQGPDWDKLAGYSKQIMAELDKTGFV